MSSCFSAIAPPQVLAIEPQTRTVCNEGSFSGFTLTCSVEILDPTVLIQRIDWRRSQQESAPEDIIADGLNTIITTNLDSTTSDSVLISSGGEVGTFMYTCVAVLSDGEQYEETASAI